MTVHVVGNATVDFSYALARLPAPGETLLAESRSVGPGGKGLNQAVAAARAGAPVAFHAPRGDDAYGALLDGALRRESGLTVRWWVGRAVTDVSSIWVGADGENMIVSTADCARSVTPSDAVSALAGARPGDWLVMQGNLPADTTAAAFARARALGLRTLLNVAPSGFEVAPMLADLDFLVGNRVEAATLGVPPESLARRLGEALIVTLGADGVEVLDRAGSRRIAAERVEALDTTGAGDAFVGTLVGALATGADFDGALAAAMRAGAAATLGRGALPPRAA